MSHFDILLAKQLNGGGGAEVEQLIVTSNGTYTAPAGKAYSPVIVVTKKFWAATYKGDVVTDLYINTDQETNNYLFALSNIRDYCRLQGALFGELRFADTSSQYPITFALYQGENIIATGTRSGNGITSIVWNTDHIILSQPYTVVKDGEEDSHTWVIFSKAPLRYGQMSTNNQG